MFSFIKAFNLVHGVQYNPEMYRGEGINQGNVTALQDDDRSTCMTPLQDGQRMAWITVGFSFLNRSTFDVKIVVFPDTFCSSPGIIVIAESSSPDVMTECVHMQTTHGADRNICEYKCHCGGCCSYVHLSIQNAKNEGLNNAVLQLCHIDICIGNWERYSRLYVNIQTHRPIIYDGKSTANIVQYESSCYSSAMCGRGLVLYNTVFRNSS